MSDIRRSILWVIFGFSLVLLWDQWQIHNGRNATFFPSSSASRAAPADTTPQQADANAAVPSATALGGVQSISAQSESAIPAALHTVRTDVLALTFSSEGGSLVEAVLLEHFSETGRELSRTQTPLKLLQSGDTHTYVAQSGLIGVQGVELPTHVSPMRKTSTQTNLLDGQDTLAVRFESSPQNGVVLATTYTLRRGAYDMDVRYEVINQGDVAQPVNLYMQLVRDGMKAGSDTPFYSTFTGPAFFSDEAKFQKVDFSDIDKNKTSFVRNTFDGYVAMVQHYFASAWLLSDGVERENFVRRAGSLYSAGMITPMGTVAPGQSASVSAQLFVGPQEEKILETLAPGLELVKDYGWLTMLAKPLYWLLEKIHGFVGNWGWSIVLLVVLIKAAFYWLNASAYRSMAKMKKVNPRIMEMRERLKGNPQQMQQEMMKIYREEKVNPLGGCFPILIQIPVFIALYWVLMASVEMRNSPWLGWIVDLSSPDPFFILPLIMAVTTILQTALNPLPPDPLQAKLMWMMPVVFSVMFFFFPAGLVLYWITNNVLTIAQQAYINHSMGVPLKFSVPKFK
jgi:YidC/Oxa1 family membrane protein insertase